MPKKTKPQVHETLGHLVEYVTSADSYFCIECDLWLELECSDPKCGYCPGRDDKLSKQLQEKDHVVLDNAE